MSTPPTGQHATIAKLSDAAKKRKEKAAAALRAEGRAFEIGDHVELARALVDELGGSDALVYDELHAWRHTPSSGLWEKIDRTEESRIVQGFSGASIGAKDGKLSLSASDVNGAIKLAGDQIAQPGFFRAAPSGVAFANGFVTVDASGATVAPLDRSHRARAGYGFVYEVTEPKSFLAFLRGTFRDDDDQAEKIAFVQEFFGACLFGIAAHFQRCVFAIGGGDNGKSRVADILIACFPEGTTSAIPPQDFGQEYRRAMLAGIRLNAVGELPDRDIIASESFKAVVSGDPIVGRMIREAPVTFRPNAGHYFAANKLPSSVDHSEGFWRRPVVLTFNRSFKDDPERDPDIHLRILASERSAIVAWLVEGAARLVRTTRYTIPSSHFAALAKWRLEADQVALFVDAEARRDEGRGIAAGELYLAYVGWTQRNGHRPLASNTFSARLRLLGIEAHKTNRGNRYPIALLTLADRMASVEAGGGLVEGF